MLTGRPTRKMIKEWKELYESRRGALYPNRRSGAEVDAYFRESYPYRLYDNEEFRQMVAANITENDFLRKKLPEGALPNIKSYTVGDVLVGIDISSGEFHVEGEDINKVISLHDDLFVYRGLDKEDLNNFFLVAEYIKLTGIE